MLHMEITGLTKSYGAVRVADNIDLRVERGEAIGIIGPNGAGKTTFFNLISGDLLGDAGRVVVKDVDMSKRGARKRARSGIARTYQIPQPFNGMTVYDLELISIVVKDEAVSVLLAKSKQETLKDAIELATAKDKLAITPVITPMSTGR